MNETLKVTLRIAMLLCQIKMQVEKQLDMLFVMLTDIDNNGRWVYRSRKSILQTGTGNAIVRFIRPHFANEEFVFMEFGVDGDWIKN